MKSKQQRGFTLIELLLVVAIIGILSAMVIPQFAGQGRKARQQAARADIEANIAMALDMYELDNGQYPTTEQGLKALVDKPGTTPVPNNWSGPYLKKQKTPADPWGNPYVYASPGTHNVDSYDLKSLGADAVESEDDVTNWEAESSP